MSAPVIDLQAIEDLRALNPGDNDQFIREIIGIFFEDTPLRIVDLEQCLASGDVVKFSRAAHSIKGSCSNLGAVGLRTVAEQLEHRSKKEGLVPLGPVVVQLKSEYESARAELRRLFP